MCVDLFVFQVLGTFLRGKKAHFHNTHDQKELIISCTKSLFGLHK